MKTVTIYGSSDDLIELEGDIRQEFGAFMCDKPSYLIFNDESCVKCEYKKGMWKLELVNGPAKVVLYDNAIDCEDKNSDYLTITGDFTNAAIWRNNPPSMDEIRDYLCEIEFYDLRDDKIKRICAIVQEEE